MNRDREAEKAAEDSPVMPLTTDRARISFGVFASPPFQGKKQRAFRPSSARTPPSFSWREDFCSKAFHKPWPRFSP